MTKYRKIIDKTAKVYACWLLLAIVFVLRNIHHKLYFDKIFIFTLENGNLSLYY